MLFDNLGNVCGANLCIPNAVRINHHGCPNRAEAHRSTFSQHHTSFRILTLRFPTKQDSARFQLVLERVPDLSTVSCGAGFTGADENMMTDWCAGHWRERPQLVNIVDECRFGHPFLCYHGESVN